MTLVPQLLKAKVSLATSRATDVANRHFRELQAALLAVSDAVMIFVGFTLAFWFRFFSGFMHVGTAPGLEECYSVIPWLVLIWILTAPAFEIYLCRPGYTWTWLFIKVVQAVLLATGVSLLFNQLSFGVRQSRLVILLGWTLSLLLIGLTRYMMHLAVSILRCYGLGTARVAVVGSGQQAADIMLTMQSNPELGYEVAGVVTEGNPPPEPLGVPVLGSLADLRAIVNTHSIEELIIALPHSQREKILDILADLETCPVRVRILSSLIDTLTRPVEVGEIGNRRLLALREHPLTGWGGVGKRSIDIATAAAGLLILSPLFAAIAVAIKVTSPGPVLYRQVRVGRDDRPFVMLKFRSMQQDAEKETGPVRASVDDRRCTPIGRRLRRSNLDELPQLINVLIGEMSLVGPRPERPEFLEEFKSQMPRYLRRHKVKAGMTGWAQANGSRGGASIEKQIELDLWYITNWSLTLDCEILLRAVREMLTRRNA